MSSFAYVGAWGSNERADEHGMYTYEWEPKSGGLRLIDRILPNVRAGGTCWHPSKDVLYVPNESAAAGHSHREGGACLYALAVDRHNGALRELGHVEAFGSNPAYCAVDKSGRYLISANHGNPQAVLETYRDEQGMFRKKVIQDESNLALFKIREDGMLVGPCDILKLPCKEGRRSSTHCAMLAPFGSLIAVCDIDNGCLYMMGIDEEMDCMVIRGCYDGEEVRSARYCVFHPSKKYLYVNNEHSALVSAFAYEEDGSLRLLGTAAVLPEDYSGPVQQSDIRIRPDGKTLYVLTRATNTAAVFAVGEDGSLERIQIVTLEGQSAKGCAVSPDGAYLYIAMRVSGDILCYTIREDGTLSEPCAKMSQPNAANLAFVEEGRICR